MSDLDDAAEVIAGHIQKLAVEIMGDESYSHLLWKTAKGFLPKAPGAGGRPPTADDGEGRWAARLILFDHTEMPMADSQPESEGDADAEPLAVFPTLRHVAEWVHATAVKYHGSEVVGLDYSTVSRRIDAIRVQLSRRKGLLINWHFPYEVEGKRWTGTIKIVRATTEQVEKAKHVRTTWRQAMPPLPVYAPGESPADLAQAAFGQQQD